MFKEGRDIVHAKRPKQRRREEILKGGFERRKGFEEREEGVFTV